MKCPNCGTRRRINAPHCLRCYCIYPKQRPGMFRSWWHAARWFTTWAVAWGGCLGMMWYLYWLVT